MNKERFIREIKSSRQAHRKGRKVSRIPFASLDIRFSSNLSLSRGKTKKKRKLENEITSKDPEDRGYCLLVGVQEALPSPYFYLSFSTLPLYIHTHSKNNYNYMM